MVADPRMKQLACGGLRREDGYWFVFSDVLSERLKRGITSLARKNIANPPTSQEDLERRLAEQAERGKEAEEFVLAFERERLVSHPWVDMVVRLSEDNVSVGYDILSFEDSTSTRLNRFIEVKSYSGQKRFHWSNNETNTAKKYPREYCIYLVEIGSIQKKGYAPEIIPDPYTWIFDMKRDWEAKPDGWIVTKK